MMSRVEGLVSVVVPVYNSELYLEETILSVLSQSYTNFELILVNDGSGDSSLAICNNFLSHPKVRIETQVNAGVSSARNRGIDLSKGEYLAFLDSDDVWLEDNLKDKVAKISSGKYGLVHSDAEIIDDQSNSTNRILQGREGWLLNDILCWNGTTIPGPSSVVLRAELLDQVQAFDKNLSTAADMDFFIRVSAEHRIGRVDKITWKYRVHSNNMHSDIQRMQEDLLYLYKKCRESGLFENAKVRRRAYGAMYRILGASWMGDGKKPLKGIGFILKSLLIYPGGLSMVLNRASSKLGRKISS